MELHETHVGGMLCNFSPPGTPGRWNLLPGELEGSASQMEGFLIEAKVSNSWFRLPFDFIGLVGLNGVVETFKP